MASIDPWEITRRRSMDYLSLLEHVSTMLKGFFPEIEIRVLYLCKGSVVPLLSVSSLRASNFGCVTVCRAPESDNLRLSLGSRWNGIIHIVEDTAILDAAMDSFSSRKVRERIKKGLKVDSLVGDTIAAYIKFHKIGLKMMKIEEWDEEEKRLPVPARVEDVKQSLESMKVGSQAETVQDLGGANDVENMMIRATSRDDSVEENADTGMNTGKEIRVGTEVCSETGTTVTMEIDDKVTSTDT